jgi:hypothetical protein
MFENTYVHWTVSLRPTSVSQTGSKELQKNFKNNSTNQPMSDFKLMKMKKMNFTLP